jgi:hypothetical protein
MLDPLLEISGTATKLGSLSFIISSAIVDWN